MWGKTYSDLAVRNAVRWIGEWDKESISYLKHLTPKLYSDIFKIGAGKRTLNEVPREEHALISFEFGLGVTQATLDYFFDGRPQHYEKYEKEVAKSLFDDGFLMNFSKSILRSLREFKRAPPKNYQNGIGWVNEYFIDICISEDKNLEALERIHEEELEQKYQEENRLESRSNTEKFSEKVIDNPKERLGIYKKLIEWERLNFPDVLNFTEDDLYDDDKWNLTSKSVSQYEYPRLTPQHSIACIETTQKIFRSFGFDSEIETKITVNDEKISELSLHRYAKVLKNLEGFTLNDLRFDDARACRCRTLSA